LPGLVDHQLLLRGLVGHRFGLAHLGLGILGLAAAQQVTGLLQRFAHLGTQGLRGCTDGQRGREQPHGQGAKVELVLGHVAHHS